MDEVNDAKTNIQQLVLKNHAVFLKEGQFFYCLLAQADELARGPRNLDNRLQSTLNFCKEAKEFLDRSSERPALRPTFLGSKEDLIRVLIAFHCLNLCMLQRMFEQAVLLLMFLEPIAHELAKHMSLFSDKFLPSSNSFVKALHQYYIRVLLRLSHIFLQKLIHARTNISFQDLEHLLNLYQVATRLDVKLFQRTLEKELLFQLSFQFEHLKHEILFKRKDDILESFVLANDLVTKSVQFFASIFCHIAKTTGSNKVPLVFLNWIRLQIRWIISGLTDLLVADIPQIYKKNDLSAVIINIIGQSNVEHYGGKCSPYPSVRWEDVSWYETHKRRGWLNLSKFRTLYLKINELSDLLASFRCSFISIARPLLILYLKRFIQIGFHRVLISLQISVTAFQWKSLTKSQTSTREPQGSLQKYSFLILFVNAFLGIFNELRFCVFESLSLFTRRSLASVLIEAARFFRQYGVVLGVFTLEPKAQTFSCIKHDLTHLSLNDMNPLTSSKSSLFLEMCSVFTLHGLPCILNGFREICPLADSLYQKAITKHFDPFLTLTQEATKC